MAKRIYGLVTHLRQLASQQGGYSSTDEIVQAIQMASMQAWNAMLPAKAQRAVGPGLNRSFDNRLHPFLRNQPYTASQLSQQAGGSTIGQFNLPYSGYVSHYEADGATLVEEVQGMAWTARLNDPNSGPTVRFPIVRDDSSTTGMGHSITPIPANLRVFYYVQPTDPLYAFDYVDDVPVYDDTNSVDTGWGPEMDPELKVRALRILGLEIRDPQLVGVAAQLTAESQ